MWQFHDNCKIAKCQTVATLAPVYTATPGLFGNKYPSIGNLSITLKGVQKLLEKINISKAAGPDLIPGRMLNMMMLAPELAPIVLDKHFCSYMLMIN